MHGVVLRTVCLVQASPLQHWAQRIMAVAVHTQKVVKSPWFGVLLALILCCHLCAELQLVLQHSVVKAGPYGVAQGQRLVF